MKRSIIVVGLLVTAGQAWTGPVGLDGRPTGPVFERLRFAAASESEAGNVFDGTPENSAARPIRLASLPELERGWADPHDLLLISPRPRYLDPPLTERQLQDNHRLVDRVLARDCSGFFPCLGRLAMAPLEVPLMYAAAHWRGVREDGGGVLRAATLGALTLLPAVGIFLPIALIVGAGKTLGNLFTGSLFSWRNEK